MDTSEFLDAVGILIYQSLVGALQWVVTIGQFGIHTAIMTLSSFQVAPQQGHMDQVKWIFSYPQGMQHASICISMDEPGYSTIPHQNYNWAENYVDSVKLVPSEAPQPLGKPITLTHYINANLMHSLLTGKSVTGILHLMNKMPMDW